jgi:FkbM family methyltransferase
MDYLVDNKCTSLPTIKPAGTSFLNTPKFKRALSPDAVSPSYYIGSVYGAKVRRHMTADLVHFKLIKERLISWSSKFKGNDNNSASSNKSDSISISGVAFDLGANQGFFTYYLAALGLDVHAFEINAENFQSLQHGQHYNGKSIAERVNLYPVGVDNKVHRFDMSGGNYGGYIKKADDSKSSSNGDLDVDNVGSDEKAASILAVTFDCFAHHSTLDLSTIPFVKIDVEGFEIAALMGASNSLFSNKTNIGAMLMEVGPDRWNRAGIDLETGIREMAKVSSTHFKQTYILLRKEEKGGGTCPVSIAEGVLADDTPEIIEDKVHKHKVAMNEWKGLLTKMNDNHWDCNFWYTN